MLPTDTELVDALARALDSGLITSLQIGVVRGGVSIVIGPASVKGDTLRDAARRLITWLQLLPPRDEPTRRSA